MQLESDFFFLLDLCRSKGFMIFLCDLAIRFMFDKVLRCTL
jgi:hypothetical protein